MNTARLIFLSVSILAIAGLHPAIGADSPKSEEGKVATVNGVDISRKDYNREVQLYKDRMARNGQSLNEQQIKIIGNQILDRMIETELLYQESRKQGVRIASDEIEAQLGKIKERFSNEQEYKAAISQMNLTEDGVRAQIEKGLAINQLVKTRIADNIKIEEEESRKFYDANPDLFKQPEEVKASHILVKVEQDAEAQKKSAAGAKIEQIQQRLKKGEDFAVVAREASEGPSAPNGGDLGYFKRGTMVKPFEDAAFALEVNQVSDVVETQFGYHLIKVYDKKPEKVLAYAEVKGQLEQHLKQQKIKIEVDTYLDGLKKDAQIEKSI